MAKAPSKGGYEIEHGEKKAKLARVTSILEVVFKEAFGAMSYYGGKLALEWVTNSDMLAEPADLEALYAAWKASPSDPNKTLRRAGSRGTAAHKLFEDLCQRRAVIEKVLEDDGYYITYPNGEDTDFVAVGYDAGAAAAYVDLFQHLDEGEIQSEVRVHWTEHPIAECPDDVCTHGYAGTADVIMPPDTIGDVKTNKGDARYSASVQMAMYALAWEQMNPGTQIDRHFVLIPRPDGTYEMFDDPKKFVSSAVVPAVLELYRARKEWGPVR